jgi:ADP-heptose:LPS heptosyltransferase
MRSRFPGRILIAALAALDVLIHLFGRSKPKSPRRILVLHHLLLGDTIMLTPLLKKLREQFPEAEIVMTCPIAFVGIYESRPYGVEVLPFDERDVGTLFGLLRQSGFDLAVVPAENRLSWLARGLGSGWIVAFSGDRPAHKSWLVDELRDFPATPMAWGDLACLLVDGPPPRPYRAEDWPAPDCAAFELPTSDYCVLHVGASTPLKLWEPEKWRCLVEHVEARGYRVVLSAGPGEGPIIDEIDPEAHRVRFPGNLVLAQLWRLLAHAKLAVCLDTGVAHLARVAGVPLVVIFGGGSASLFGGGEFWHEAIERKVTIPNFPCRDENVIFRRQVPWAGNCARTLRGCQAPRCLQQLPSDATIEAVDSLLKGISPA